MRFNYKERTIDQRIPPRHGREGIGWAISLLRIDWVGFFFVFRDLR
jgi:hypothetical protein